MLKSCGLGMQITAGMFLIGGLFGLAGRLCSGEWMPLAGREWSPLVSGLLVGLIIVYGAGYIALGAAVKAGKREATLVSVLLAWPVWLAMLVYFLSTWNGGGELILWSFLLMDAHVALTEVDEVPEATTAGE